MKTGHWLLAVLVLVMLRFWWADVSDHFSSLHAPLTLLLSKNHAPVRSRSSDFRSALLCFSLRSRSAHMPLVSQMARYHVLKLQFYWQPEEQYLGCCSILYWSGVCWNACMIWWAFVEPCEWYSHKLFILISSMLKVSINNKPVAMAKDQIATFY